MTLKLHSGASREIDAAIEWYEARQPGLGEAFLREVSPAFDVILENPRLWPVWPGWRSETLPVRRFVLYRFPFSVAYLPMGSRVVVLAIAHSKRRPNYWRDRVPR